MGVRVDRCLSTSVIVKFKYEHVLPLHQRLNSEVSVHLTSFNGGNDDVWYVSVSRDEVPRWRSGVGGRPAHGLRCRDRAGNANGDDQEDQAHLLSAPRHETSPRYNQSASPQPPNGEVEGPGSAARLEPRAQTVSSRPRRHYPLSRHPPTIVRQHAD